MNGVQATEQSTCNKESVVVTNESLRGHSWNTSVVVKATKTKTDTAETGGYQDQNPCPPLPIRKALIVHWALHLHRGPHFAL